MRTILVPTDFSSAANNAVHYAAQLAKKITGKVRKTAVSEEVFKAIKDHIESGIGRHENIQFAREFSKNKENFANLIQEYMRDDKADLLSITFYDRALLPKLFHGSIAKKISEAANYPLLVLHV